MKQQNDFNPGFWSEVSKPIVALAPMEDVTDTVFREVIRSVSDPEVLNVLFTEFTSTDGMCNETGRQSVSTRLIVSDSEKRLLQQTNTRLVAQIWGSDPDKFCATAQMISRMGLFDGIDINMGCPVKKVVKNRSCSALINYPELAKEIIAATMDGTSLPVSVKTRIGFNQVITEEWIGELLTMHPAAITIHGRTRQMMSEGEAMWDEIGKAVKLRDAVHPGTLILGNGDVSDYATIRSHVDTYGVDGVMVGRGVFRNPWMFRKELQQVTFSQRIDLIRKHIALYDAVWHGKQNFNVLKRFFKIYINGFEGAAYWRDKLMHTSNCAQALEVVSQISVL